MTTMTFEYVIVTMIAVPVIGGLIIVLKTVVNSIIKIVDAAIKSWSSQSMVMEQMAENLKSLKQSMDQAADDRAEQTKAIVAPLHELASVLKSYNESIVLSLEKHNIANESQHGTHEQTLKRICAALDIKVTPSKK